ncbi:MAG: hypothetical protein JSV43_09050 [Methanobacteriota archaeon]|nr:MAG: hypothetical protein JSV43_09050 [Euryarchaeota archaeon]
MDAIDLAFFFIEILIVMIILYVATRLVCKEEVVSAIYLLRLFVTAFLAVVLVPLFQGMLESQFHLGIVGVIIAFFLLVLIIRYVIVSEASLGDEIVESILIAIITVVAIFIINFIMESLFPGIGIISGIF